MPIWGQTACTWVKVIDLTRTCPYSDTVSPSWHHQQMIDNVNESTYHQQMITSQSSRCHIVSSTNESTQRQWVKATSMSQSNVNRRLHIEVVNVTSSYHLVNEWSQRLLQVSVNSANWLIYKHAINEHASTTELAVNAHLAAYRTSTRIPIGHKIPCK